MARVQIRNDFHGTICNLHIPYQGAPLTPGQIRRCKSTLCGIPGCTCGGTIGERGNQGSVHIVVTGCDDETGKALVTVDW